LSTQWSSDGYFYAIQIAQYGLSHYSKNLTEKSVKVRVLENGESGLQVGDEVRSEHEVGHNDLIILVSSMCNNDSIVI